MKNNKFVLGLLLGLTFFLFIAAFTRDWTESTPTDSTVANQIDDYNRYLRVDASDRLKNMFYGFIAGENTLSQHAQYIQFYEQASVSQPSAGYGRWYTKAVGGKCETFWQDEDGDEIEVTEGGKLVIGYGTASQAIMWNTTEEDGEEGRESQIRATGEQSGGERTTLGYLEFSHDGTADDQKGRCRIVLNDGDDSDVPSKVAIVFQADGTIDVGDSVAVLDEDNMASDSATAISSQQAIVAYGALQAWANKSIDTTYQAATDGFVVAYATKTAGAVGLTGYTDSNADPTGTTVALELVSTAASSYVSMMFPVLKDDYWRVADTQTNTTNVVRWVPLHP